jgi:hypothetical protein
MEWSGKIGMKIRDAFEEIESATNARCNTNVVQWRTTLFPRVMTELRQTSLTKLNSGGRLSERSSRRPAFSYFNFDFFLKFWNSDAEFMYGRVMLLENTFERHVLHMTEVPLRYFDQKSHESWWLGRDDRETTENRYIFVTIADLQMTESIGLIKQTEETFSRNISSAETLLPRVIEWRAVSRMNRWDA